MPDNDWDPAASTQMFRAFVESGRDEQVTAKTGGSNRRLLGVLGIGLVTALAVAWFLFA